MRLPNGYGSVYKLSGKRRNPWAVRVTSEWSIDTQAKTARQKYRYVGFYPTRQKAMDALAEYNSNPYDLSADPLSFTDVYENWSKIHFQEIVPSAQRTWVSAYNHSKPLHNMRFRDIRVSHLEGTLRDATVGNATKQRMKSLYNQLYQYALKHEIVDKDYAALCDSVKKGKPVREPVPFTNDEIKLLWDNLDVPYVDMILIGIYSGWRPQELSVLRLKDIDLNEMTMFGGLKTDAGKNRYVPIHPCIQELIRKRYSDAKQLHSTHLFNDPNSQSGMTMSYDKYQNRFKKTMKQLSLSHRPHETRHTFITLAKNAGMNEYILKMIVGHEIQDLTERVYTHRTIEDLGNEIKKIEPPA